MICKSCGRANEQGAKFCKSCGAPLEGGTDVQQNNKVGYQQKNMGYQQYDMSGNMNFGTTRMTKEEFNQCANIKTIIKNITIAAIITYVIGAISLITNVILGGNIFGFIRCDYCNWTRRRSSCGKEQSLCSCSSGLFGI